MLIKKLRKAINKYLNIKMTMYFSIVIAGFGICLMLVIGAIFSLKWRAEIDKVVCQKMTLIDSQISSKMQNIQNRHYELVRNTFLEDYIKKSDEEYNNKKQVVTNVMKGFKEDRAEIVSAFIVDANNNIVDTRENNVIYKELVSNQNLYEFKNSEKMRKYSAPNTFPLQIANPTLNERNTITYIGRYYDSENYNLLGYLFINIKKSHFLENVESISKDTFQKAYIIDDNGETIYSLEDEETQFQNTEINRIINEKEIEVDGDRYLVYQSKISEYPQWIFTGLVSVDSINKNIYEVYKVIIALGMIVFIVVVFISFRISKSVTSPLTQVIKAMNEIGKGNKPKNIKYNNSSEIGALVEGFNTMNDNIKELNEKVIRDQKEKSDYEVSVIKSRLQILQSQINPHFIHNTLNALKYMAQKEGNTDLVDTIAAFNTLLRSSMSVGRDIIKIYEEIENITNYMKIQKKRYDAEVITSYYIYDDMDNGLIPKMILQPLVENALYHGIIPKGGGEISISIRREGQWVKITVSDNGVGIPAEKQRDILKVKENSGRGYNNIGLGNVNERLMLYYGEESKINILSSEEFGTFISFKIPYQK